MRRQTVCVLIGASLSAIGCASGPLDDSVWAERRPLGGELAAVQPSADPRAAASGTFEEPGGSITLRDALAAALMHSPALAAAGYEVRAREAETLQAGLLPNPDLAVEIENFGGSRDLGGFGSAETTLALSQVVELGGKRLGRQRAAGQRARLAGWDYEVRRIDVLSKTAADFIGLLAAERRLLIAADTLELARRVAGAVEERVDAGKVSPLEKSRAGIELARAELVHERAKRDVSGARTRLASNWGGTTPRFDAIVGDLDRVEAPPALKPLLALVEHNPDLARWTAEAALRQAEVELALGRRVPDLTLSGGVRLFEEGDETAFVAGLALPLPVFDRNQGGIRAARLRALQGGRLEEAARVQVSTTIAEAHQNLDAAFVEVRMLRERLLPSAELTFAAAEEAFRQGKIDALGLLDAERTLFDARRELTDALAAYHLAVVACERLTGTPMSEDLPQEAGQ